MQYFNLILPELGNIKELKDKREYPDFMIYMLMKMNVCHNLIQFLRKLWKILYEEQIFGCLPPSMTTTLYYSPKYITFC